MRTYSIAQRTLLSALQSPRLERNPKKEYICIHIADSLCCIVETNTILLSNYIPIRIF